MVKGALGGGMHVETADYQPDHDYQVGTFTGNSQQPWKGNRRVDSVFAESGIPIFGKDFSCTLLHKLEGNGCGAATPITLILAIPRIPRLGSAI